MSRRAPHTGVSLFPFLDVLMCTMGALILLLIVTARNIHRGNQEAVSASVAIASIVPLPVTPAPATAPTPPPPPQVDRSELEARRLAHQALLAERQRAWEERQREIESQRSKWTDAVNALREEQRQLALKLQQLRDRLAEETSAQTGTITKQQELTALIQAAEQQQKELAETDAKLQQQLQELDQRRLILNRELETKQVQQSQRKPRFEIVAYDGASGTSRRPILVECRADGLTFAAERISLTAKDLVGFTPEINPLKDGSEALIAYWTTKDGKSAKDKTGPYLLLIVRPGGTVGFYVARKLLEKMDYEFGYELVYADEEIRWPEPDPEAVRVCEEAVRKSYATRETLAPIRGRSLLSNEVKLVGEDGNFHLPEIDELRATPDASFNRRSQATFTPPKRDLPASLGGGRPLPTNVPPRSTASGLGGNGFPAGDPVAREGGMSPAGSAAAPGRGPDGSSNSEPNRFPLGSLNPGSAAGMPRELGQSAPEESQPGSPSYVQNAKPLPRMFPGETVRQMPREQGAFPDGPTPLPARSAGGRGGKWTEDGGERKKWGETRPNGAIGIEREIKMHLYADRMEIHDGPTAIIPADAGRPEFQAAMSELLQRHALGWGRPPDSFFWRPVLKVVIHPGGNQHYPRMKELVDHWGLNTTTEQSIE
ncbi:hypothetical protein [Planctomicrobium sp. SH664]|uniref:hypothetical protein n=1 Tax=Planctomicrobium sp. SH664 TaxID=3448125 RepID=UPI003F5C00C4